MRPKEGLGENATIMAALSALWRMKSLAFRLVGGFSPLVKVVPCLKYSSSASNFLGMRLVPKGYEQGQLRPKCEPICVRADEEPISCV